MGLVKNVLNKELRCNPTRFQRECISNQEFVDSIQHSLTLEGHNGCVNTMCWNLSGTLLASGSDDQTVIVWGEDGRLIKRVSTAHVNNIFSVIFLNNSHDSLLASAAGDHLILLHDLDHLQAGGTESHVQKWECKNRVKRLATCNALPRLFWSACEDGILRQHDIRTDKADEILDLSDMYQLKSLSVNHTHPEMIALALNDSMVPIFDQRNRKIIQRLLPAHLTFYDEERRRSMRSALTTHVAFSHRGDEIIVNIGSENIYIFNVFDNESTSCPDVLEPLESFLEERTISSGKLLDCTDSLMFKDVRRQMKKYMEEKEYSKGVDFCSTALSVYLRSNRISLTPFMRQPPNLVKERRRQCAADLGKLYQLRGLTYLTRNWEADAMAALRDFLYCLEISADNREAHFHLLKVLGELKQGELKRRCLELYQKRFGEDEHVRELMAPQPSTPKKNGELNQNYAWTRAKYGKYRDYTDRYYGHYNFNTDIKEANWLGGRDEMIVAGSDYGSMFIWDRNTQKILRLFKADEYSVNCVQCHPNRLLIASSGIDNVIRFWEPGKVTRKRTSAGEVEEDRDLTDRMYEVASNNQRSSNTLESLIGFDMRSLLFDSTDMDLITGDAADIEYGDGADSTNGGEPVQAIRCRTM